MNKTFKFALPSPNFNKSVQDACKPKPHYLTPSGMSLLPREKQPPPMYGRHGSTLPARYLKHHAVQEQQDILTTSPPEKQYCEPCEMELNSLEDLKRHRAQHEKCPVAGCLYKGHPSVMDKHINALHASGLFDKFKKFSTPEEIAAWREERRKRYPTLANVLLKQKAKEQRQKRGERLENNKNRFGNINDRKRTKLNVREDNISKEEKKPKEENKKKSKNKNRKNKNTFKNQELQPKVQVDKKRKSEVLEEENELSCVGIKMFRGTSQLKNFKHFNEKKEAAKNALFGLVGMYGSDDEESSGTESLTEEENSEALNDIEKNESNITEIMQECFENKGKGKESYFMNDSETDCYLKEQRMETVKGSINLFNENIMSLDPKPLILDSIEQISISAVNETCKQNDKLSDDEAPEETPIQRCISYFPSISEQEQKTTILNEPETKCSGSKTERNVIPNKKRNKKFGLDYRKARLRKQNTMLEKLLESDIRHERNVLLQCIRFVCENKFFNIGQYKNQSGQDNKKL